MCGLLGLIVNRNSGFDNPEIDTFVGNMFVNAYRGHDSTGVVQVDTKGDTFALKVLGGPAEIVHAQEWEGFRTKLFKNTKIAFGHGRWATRGTVTLENAHPFYVKNKEGHEIVLVHNGTLLDWQRLPNFKAFDVDSLWLAQQIVDLGPEEALSKINGAIAAMWWNDHENTFYMYRNDERPLHIATEKDGTMHFNSTAGSLAWLQNTFRLDYKQTDIKILKSRHLFRFPLKDPQTWTSKEIQSFIPPYTPPARTEHKWDQDYNDRNNCNLVQFPPNKKYTVTSDTGLLRDITEMFAGNINKIMFFKNGGKYRYYKDGSIETTNGLVPPRCVPHLCKIELVGTDQVSVTTKEISGVASIRTFTQNEFNKWWSDQEKRIDQVAVDVKLKPGGIIKFHTNGKHKGGDVVFHHKAVCERGDARYLQIYSNEYDGTFEHGSRIPFEPYEYLPVDGNALQFRVRGVLTTLDGGANVTTEILTAKYSKKEMMEEGLLLGTVVSLKLTSVREKEVFRVGDVLIQLIDAELISTMNEEDERLCKIQQELVFGEAFQKLNKGRRIIVPEEGMDE